jgi:hypothetical protein
MKPDPKSKKLLDAWGSPYVMFCGANLPPGARGIAVMSLGPDQKQGTRRRHPLVGLSVART